MKGSESATLKKKTDDIGFSRTYILIGYPWGTCSWQDWTVGDWLALTAAPRANVVQGAFSEFWELWK